MARTTQFDSLNIFLATDDHIDAKVVFATFDSGTDTIADLEASEYFAPGARLIDLATGANYINEGTSASPDFQQAESDSLEQEVELSSAEILALNTTPIELLPAPGAGAFLVIENIVGFNDYDSATYAFDGDLEIRYTDESGAKATEDFAEVAFAEAAADAYQVAAPVTVVPVANAPIVAWAAGAADPTTGDGTFKFNIKYRVVTFA